MQNLRRWQVSHLLRAGVVVLQAGVLAGCSTALQKQFGAYDDKPDATTATVRNADFSARFTAATDEAPDRQRGESSKPLLFPGTEPESPAAPSRDPGSSYRIGSRPTEFLIGQDPGTQVPLEDGLVRTIGHFRQEGV